MALASAAKFAYVAAGAVMDADDDGKVFSPVLPAPPVAEPAIVLLAVDGYVVLEGALEGEQVLIVPPPPAPPES
eukprot:16111564-Heterocapsa_arctica.AAC.1